MSDDGTGSETGTHSDLDMGDERVPDQPRLVHFKCEFDPTWDWKSIANTLFIPDAKILVVGEKFNKNKHVHLQGYTWDAARTFANRLNELAKSHCSRDPTSLYYRGPKTRPTSQGRNTVDDIGFQYMSKEPLSAHNPIYSNGFTPEELAELHATSTAVVEKKKHEMIEFLHEKLVKTDFHQGWDHLELRAFHYVHDELRRIGKPISFHTRKDVYRAIQSHPECTPYLGMLAIQKF